MVSFGIPWMMLLCCGFVTDGIPLMIACGCWCSVSAAVAVNASIILCVDNLPIGIVFFVRPLSVRFFGKGRTALYRPTLGETKPMKLIVIFRIKFALCCGLVHLAVTSPPLRQTCEFGGFSFVARVVEAASMPGTSAYFLRVHTAFAILCPVDRLESLALCARCNKPQQLL